MRDESSPIDKGEKLYRRVPFVSFEPTAPTPVQVTAFRPTNKDLTGISLYRADCLGNPEEIIPHDKRERYWVVQITVAELESCGLSVVPKPDPAGPPGHCEIPELSKPAYDANKEKLKKYSVS